MEPISQFNNKPVRSKKTFTYRPYTEDRLQQMSEWLQKEKWSQVAHEASAHKKMEVLQNILLNKYHEYFPEKLKTISSDDQPFYTDKLKRLKRKKSREYYKNRKSLRWEKINHEYKTELEKAKKVFYNKKIRKLRRTQSKYWYRELKKITSFDQLSNEDIIVDEIKELSAEEQAEKIADKFASVSQEFDAIETKDIEVPEFKNEDIPVISLEEVKEALKTLDTNKSNVNNDIPAKVLKHFSDEIAVPLTEVINASIVQGCWPDILKREIVTPVPKIFPPKDIDDLRNISGLLNLDKIAEKIISKMIISDMKLKLDPSQYANQRGLSINHYLVKLMDKILHSLDNNSKKEAVAVLASLVD